MGDTRAEVLRQRRRRKPRAETEGPFRPRLVPGWHFYLISGPQVVLRELGLELRAAVRRVS